VKDRRFGDPAGGSTDAPARHSVARIVVAGVLSGLLVACASDTESSSSTTGTTPPTITADDVVPLLRDVTGELILTRQRDLLDRGLINVLVTNHGRSSLLLDDIELDADHFDTQPAADRTISIRPDRQVAIQVPYGEVADCVDASPVEASLGFVYTSDDDPIRHDTSVLLGGTELLDVIRAEQCAVGRFHDAVTVGFADTSAVDGSLATNLVIEPDGGSVAAEMEIAAVAGTILVSARRSDESTTPIRVGAEPVALPLSFVVNRCDPHALGEVTKRFGLDLSVSIDGADPVSVAVDVGPIESELEAIVELCRARNSND
jgi:hypothetical protein